MKLRSKLSAVAAAAAVVAMVAMPAAGAQAATQQLPEMDIASDAGTLMYSQFYTHYTAAYASLNVSHLTECGGYTNIGLRSSAGVQKGVNSWYVAGTKQILYQGSPHDTRFPAGSYAFNARMYDSAGCPGYNYWTGVLTW